MKKDFKKSLFFAFMPWIFASSLNAQNTAFDFTENDLNGNPHHLYQYLNEGKLVVLDFMEGECGPCMNYHQTQALNNLYNHYGPNGTILPNQVMVLMIDVWELSTLPDLNGDNGMSYNWIAETDYPIIDLQPETYPAQNQILQEYQSWGTPTIVKICPEDNKAYTINDLSAYATDQNYMDWFNGPSCKNTVAGYQDHFDLELNIHYFLNQETNELTLKSDVTENLSVKIVSVTGQLVYSEELENFSTQKIISLQDLTPGMYTIHTASDKSALSQSIVINH